MQKYLSQGYITQFDKATRRGYNYDFSGILEECNQNVAKEAIDYFCELFNYFLEYRYLIQMCIRDSPHGKGICPEIQYLYQRKRTLHFKRR